jgi:HD-like signal output (HDOD) protein
LKRILFVDDEQNILEGLQDLLRKYRREMEMVFATSGKAALEELRSRPFDVVVSDMRMPEMDGATLLQKVKEEFPDIIRIVLSGHADRSAIFQALPFSHQFLAKPCDADTLRGVIERSCRLRAVLSDESLRKHIGNLDKLPSLPRVHNELVTAMSRPDVSPATIARIIEQDSSMSAKVLQLVNSACFGATRSIARIDQAVTYLGMDLVKNLALIVHVFSSLAGRSCDMSVFENIQDHAIRTSRVASRLLKDPQKAQEAFTAALLHDVGRVILAFCIPDRYSAVVETARATARPLHEVETEILGVNHAAIGAYLLGLWGLPFGVVEAVAYHHDPAAAGEKTLGVATAVSFADSLLELASGNPSSLDEAHLENLNVLKELPRWKEIALEEQQQHEMSALSEVSSRRVPS